MKKEHAEHNERACDFLLTSQDFNDWVITTAFYAALHYVQHEIFPFSQNGHEYKNIEAFMLARKNSKIRKSKHSLTIELVETYVPKAALSYRWLYDACMNARYNQYQTSPQKAQLAKIYLSNLKQALTK